MTFDDFALGRWLSDQKDAHIHFDFGSSTGPVWSLRDVLALDENDAAERLASMPLSYSKPAGRDALRESIAEMFGVPSEHVLVLTGGAEALTHIFLAAAEPGANVVVPSPCYATRSDPESI